MRSGMGAREKEAETQRDTARIPLETGRSEFDQILKKHFRGPSMFWRTLLDDFPGLDERHLEAAYSIGFAAFKQHKYEDAEKIFYCLAMMNHFEVRYWKALAVTLFIEHKYDAALGVYLAAYFLNPSDIEVISAMADCCLALENREGAIEFFNQVVEVFQETQKRPDLAERARGTLELIRQNTKNHEEAVS
ncbi:MAG: hypothetical protein LW808_000350 [Verrucomicrobiota bacterium]|nr:MAG: hypothetical protein LW808_000350 [Verrucomicrobiota bacterium]